MGELDSEGVLDRHQFGRVAGGDDDFFHFQQISD